MVVYVRYCDPLPVIFIRVTDMLAIIIMVRKALSILLLFLCIISEKIEDLLSFKSSIYLPVPGSSGPPESGIFYTEVFSHNALYSDKIIYAVNIEKNVEKYKKMFTIIK